MVALEKEKVTATEEEGSLEDRAEDSLKLRAAVRQMDSLLIGSTLI